MLFHHCDDYKYHFCILFKYFLTTFIGYFALLLLIEFCIELVCTDSVVQYFAIVIVYFYSICTKSIYHHFRRWHQHE